MLNIKCLIFQHIIRVHSNICPICQQTSECPMQRTMLGAPQATDELLIALQFVMRISAYLAFSSSAQSISNQVTIWLVKLIRFFSFLCCQSLCVMVENWEK